MIDPDVRRARSDDADNLHALEELARAELRDTRGGQRWLDTHQQIGTGWPSVIEGQAVFVATIPVETGEGPPAEVIVGFLVARRLPDPMPVARIDQVFVHADARELGFGDGLVAAALDWARDGSAELIEAETLPGDRNLKNLYERAGVTARLITVSKRL